MSKYYIIYCGKIILDGKWFETYDDACNHLNTHPENVVSACEIARVCYPMNLYGAPVKSASPRYYPGITEGEIDGD